MGIQVQSLSKRYGRMWAVRDLSFEVQPGKVTGFLGPNGAGKSTTMRSIVGLDRPTTGTALIDGARYARLRAPLQEVGTLLDARAAHRSRRAVDHLRTVAATHGFPAARVDEVIGLTGLESAARVKAGKFSLGMGQRLGIAVALLGDPHTLILDEPVNGLDPEGVTWIRGLLSALAAEGRTVFLSSHLLSELALVADHVVVLGRGRLIADAPLMTLTSDAGRTLEEASGRLIEAHVAGRTRAGGGPPLRTLLSPREYDVFLGIAQGLSNPEIAVRLTLALPTIKTHVNRILAKLDARDRVHLVILAYDHDIAPALPENPPGRGRTAAR